MKRTLISIALSVVIAAPLVAQTAASTASASETVVAQINGETITKAQLDHLWQRLGERARQQYEKTGGGKAGFLANYVSKKLIVQKALQGGFDKKADVQAELEATKESALFDLYVRDVVASQVVTEAEMKKFYNDNPTQFAAGERRYLRYLLISTKKHSKEEAREILGPIMADLISELARAKGAGAPPQVFGQKFSEFARKHSEDATASAGGDIGWFEQSQLDPKLAEGVFSMPIGTMSGILENDLGFQLIYVEARRDPEKETFEQARTAIREYLLGTNREKILQAVNDTTTALRTSGKVTLFPENVD